MVLPAHGITIYTFGNASAVNQKKGVIAIKSSGGSNNELTRDDMSTFSLDGDVEEGALNPSSDFMTLPPGNRYAR